MDFKKLIGFCCPYDVNKKLIDMELSSYTGSGCRGISCLFCWQKVVQN